MDGERGETEDKELSTTAIPVPHPNSNVNTSVGSFVPFFGGFLVGVSSCECRGLCPFVVSLAWLCGVSWSSSMATSAE